MKFTTISAATIAALVASSSAHDTGKEAPEFCAHSREYCKCTGNVLYGKKG